MLILGIGLTISGYIIFEWSTHIDSKINYSKINYSKSNLLWGLTSIMTDLIWVALLASGFYILWQVSPKIVLVAVGIYSVATWTLHYFILGEKARAKRIFKIYIQLKSLCPETSDKEIFIETADAYFHGLSWNENKIKMTIATIFEEKAGSKYTNKDIKNIASSIMIFEKGPRNDFMSRDFKKITKRLSKRQKNINDAYDAIIGDN